VVSVDLQSVAAPGCVSLVGDVADPATARAAVAMCVERFGRVDLMAAHTGIAEPRPVLETDDEHWRKHMAVNVDGVFWCVREAARAMVSSGRGGAIVCTASINAWHVEETMAAYNVSKAAVHAIARSAAIDLGRHGVRVNAVAPGVVDTPIAALVVHNPEVAPEYLKTIPLGRFGLPRDIADAVLFLASDDASYITGQMLVIDGGQTLGITGDLVEAASS
jgi:meso-butanediol dehydrogenase / (S,S)-butanediol dehydrogenase / diacetyl reductase